MNSINARIFAERLKIPMDGGQHVVFCPFHMDSGTKSFSVDLSKGVFFCHGGCDEPKGGGALEFLMRWAKLIEKKTLTRVEAMRMLRRTFAIPNAQTLMREHAESELLLFAQYMMPAAATELRELERTLAGLHSRCQGIPPASGNWIWDAFAAVYAQQELFEWVFDTCLASQRHLSDDLVLVYATAKERGWWNPMLATVLASDARKRATYTRLRNARKPANAPRTPVKPTESESLCRVPLSHPTRTPVSLKQPVPPLRRPVP